MFPVGHGVRLGDVEAKAFAFVRREGEATLTKFKADTGLSGSAAYRAGLSAAQVEPLARAGVAAATHPDQAYAPTEVSAALKTRHVNGG